MTETFSHARILRLSSPLVRLVFTAEIVPKPFVGCLPFLLREFSVRMRDGPKPTLLRSSSRRGAVESESREHSCHSRAHRAVTAPTGSISRHAAATEGAAKVGAASCSRARPKGKGRPSPPFCHEEWTNILNGFPLYEKRTRSANGTRLLYTLVLLMRFSGMRTGDTIRFSHWIMERQ